MGSLDTDNVTTGLNVAEPMVDNQTSRKTKRRKKEDEISILEPQRRCVLSQLPLELLAEILINTCSPKDVLSFARSSKFFCTTLLNPSSTFIWRGARQICEPEPMPDPISTFTESSYAAFVFDGGKCEICRKETDSMYISFALRLRLCRNNQCTAAFIADCAEPSDSEFDRALAKLVPCAESNQFFAPYGVGQLSKPIYRGIDWVREGTRWLGRKPQEILISAASKVKYTAAVMEFSVALAHWKGMRQVLHKNIKSANDALSRSFAVQHGWKYLDLVHCTPYGDLHTHKCKTLQYITALDCNLLVPSIEKRLIKVAEQRKRRAHEASYRQNRMDIAQHYNRIRSMEPSTLLPTLPIFRRLPVVSTLQASPAATTKLYPVSETLKDTTSWVHKTLDTELRQWIETTKQSLGAILGYPNWKTASTNTLHPAERITARFLCQNCTKLATRFKEDECFDFAGACSHVCHTSKRKKRLDETWDAGRFIKDDKAINAMSTLVALHDADPASEGCRALIDSIGVRIACLSCEPAIVMSPKSIVGHSHRHENMKMVILSEAEAQSMLTYPFESGLTRKLMYNAKSKQDMKNYGCRHCPNKQLSERPSTEDTVPELQLKKDGGHDGKRKELKQTTKAFTFNGLRSHVKALHNIEHIRDEDFFCYEPLNWEQ